MDAGRSSRSYNEWYLRMADGQLVQAPGEEPARRKARELGVRVVMRAILEIEMAPGDRAFGDPARGKSF